MFLVWCRSHPVLLAIAGLLGLGVGSHWLSNWSADHRWESYVRDARSRGIKLTLPEFAREKIPEEQNFAALPMMQVAFKGTSPAAFDLPGGAPGTPARKDAVDEKDTEWPAWQAYFEKHGLLKEISDNPQRDVLRALEHYAPQMQEWAQWRTRPQCRFDLDLKAGAAMSFAHLNVFMRAAKVFALQSRTHTSLGEPGEAFAALEEIWPAYTVLRDDPACISGLVRLAVLAQLGSALGDGLRAGAWNETQLRQIDAHLTEVRLWDDYQRALGSERGFCNTVFNEWAGLNALERGRRISAQADSEAALGLSSVRWSPWEGALLPRRIFRDNQLRQNRWFDEMLAVSSDGQWRFDPDRVTPSAPDHLTGATARYYFLFRLSLPIYRLMEKKYVAQQIFLEEARLAVALARYRHARGVYPEKLAELAPEFLAKIPRDPWSGLDYHYQPGQESAGFELYSVGENRRDDGGRVDRKRKENDQLDVIWCYAPRS